VRRGRGVLFLEKIRIPTIVKKINVSNTKRAVSARFFCYFNVDEYELQGGKLPSPFFNGIALI